MSYDIGATFDRDLIGTIPYYGRFNSKVFRYPSKILFGFLPSTGILAIDSLLSFQPILFIDAMFHITLPVLTLMFPLLAIVVKMTRSSMIETMKQDYILLARAKGLSERVIIYKHALRNAMIPTLTVSGLTLANLLTGVVFVEMIFYWPGIGGLFVWQGLNFMDMPIIQGYILITTTMFIVINVVIDLLYGFIDPRIRLIEI
jgi:peptide/nickel transport system permease protein